MDDFKALVIIIVTLFSVSNAGAGPVQFHGNKYPITDTGFFTLKWDHTSKIRVVELQQSLSSDFEIAETLYKGHYQSFFLSGLKNGKYYYRIKESNNPWSETLSLTVQHHSIQEAWLLFMIGALVFASIVAVILKGSLYAK